VRHTAVIGIAGPRKAAHAVLICFDKTKAPDRCFIVIANLRIENKEISTGME
jgi:hypothetical protein